MAGDVSPVAMFWILVRNFCWGKFRDGTKFEASRSAPANEHSNGNSETSSVQWTLQWRSSTLAGWRCSTLAFFLHSTSPVTAGPSGKRLGTTWCHAGLMWKSKILPKKVAQGKHENTAALYTVVFEQFHTHLLSWRVAVVGEWPAEVLCLVKLQCCTNHKVPSTKSTKITKSTKYQVSKVPKVSKVRSTRSIKYQVKMVAVGEWAGCIAALTAATQIQKYKYWLASEAKYK